MISILSYAVVIACVVLILIRGVDAVMPILISYAVVIVCVVLILVISWLGRRKGW